MSATDLARARRARDEQVRHPQEIRNGGPPADVLAEHERQRRLELVVGLGFHDLGERHELAHFVRNLEPDIGLAGYDLHDAHAHRRQRASKVLREITDLTDFDAGRGLELEARDDGARMHRDDFDFDAEVAELELDETRHRLEHLGAITAFSDGRFVEQRQFRKLGGRRRLEQRNLPLTLGPRADLDAFERRLDPGRARARPRAVRDDLLLALELRAPAVAPGLYLSEQNIDSP